MEILEYDQVDPLQVLNLNLLSLDYALTPERVALIRRLDARSFPCFALYGVEEGVVAGQVALYRLPVMTVDGPEEVGGVSAVCTHPAFSRRGIADRLMDEAHARMRLAGLRFSTLGTSRYRGAYDLYHRQGYQDVYSSTSTFARLADVRRDTRLRLERATPQCLHLADEFFQRIASGYLGFARRSPGFISALTATGDLHEEEFWLLWDGSELAGYAVANVSGSILSVYNLLLAEEVEAWEAVAAWFGGAHPDQGEAVPLAYVRVRIDHPSVAASLQRAGYPLPQPDWSVFMLKPLVPEVSLEAACRLLGIGTDRFLMSYFDIT